MLDGKILPVIVLNRRKNGFISGIINSGLNYNFVKSGKECYASVYLSGGNAGEFVLLRGGSGPYTFDYAVFDASGFAVIRSNFKNDGTVFLNNLSLNNINFAGVVLE